MFPFSLRPALVLVLLATLAVPAFAKKNNPNVQLKFVPQQAVASVEADVTPGMLRRPVAVRIEDARPGEDAAKIGSRTDDDDRKIALKAVNRVVDFAATAADEILTRWGIKTDDGAGLVLVIHLAQFTVEETNQAVGATYNAEIRLAAELTGDADWSGGSTGDATRYGKKFSNDNVNEVLSDALLEALANLVSDRGLQAAWEE
jgi:uncharacterized lipoprotein YajG